MDEPWSWQSGKCWKCSKSAAEMLHDAVKQSCSLWRSLRSCESIIENVSYWLINEFSEWQRARTRRGTTSVDWSGRRMRRTDSCWRASSTSPPTNSPATGKTEKDRSEKWGNHDRTDIDTDQSSESWLPFWILIISISVDVKILTMKLMKIRDLVMTLTLETLSVSWSQLFECNNWPNAVE